MDEYGGYLPLELVNKEEYYGHCLYPAQRYNTGRTAIYCALLDCKPSKVFIPHYICNTVYDLIKSMKIPVERFFINSKLEPIDLKINSENNEYVLLVNYFGLMTDFINKGVGRYKNVIIDNTQAFFSEPIIRKGVYNVYSCRKFIGVPDGAYLIGSQLGDFALERDISYDRYIFLLQAYEQGTNTAYEKNLENEKYLNDNRKLMSILTKKMLNSVDYKLIKNRRRENFNLMHTYFKKINRFHFEQQQQVPYIYPLLLNNEKVKAKLIENHIYVPTLWKEMICKEYQNTVEYDFSKHLICLPVDQRYSTKNITELCRIVECVLKEGET